MEGDRLNRTFSPCLELTCARTGKRPRNGDVIWVISNIAAHAPITMSMRERVINHAMDRLRGEGCLASPEATGRRGPVTAARDGDGASSPCSTIRKRKGVRNRPTNQ